MSPYRIDRRKQKKETDFETLHHDYIDHWDHFHENLYENDRRHTNENFRAYLYWYRRATRTKLKVQWTHTDYADIESSDDGQTSYDLATRAGTQVEPTPILDRVVMSTITPSYLFQLGMLYLQHIMLGLIIWNTHVKSCTTQTEWSSHVLWNFGSSFVLMILAISNHCSFTAHVIHVKPIDANVPYTYFHHGFK